MVKRLKKKFKQPVVFYFIISNMNSFDLSTIIKVIINTVQSTDLNTISWYM